MKSISIIIACLFLISCNAANMDAMVRQSLPPVQYDTMSEEYFNARVKDRSVITGAARRGATHYRGPLMVFDGYDNSWLSAIKEADGSFYYQFNVERSHYAGDNRIYDRAVDMLGTSFDVETDQGHGQDQDRLSFNLPAEYVMENQYDGLLLTIYERIEDGSQQTQQWNSVFDGVNAVIGGAQSSDNQNTIDIEIPNRYLQLFVKEIQNRMSNSVKWRK